MQKSHDVAIERLERKITNLTSRLKA